MEIKTPFIKQYWVQISFVLTSILIPSTVFITKKVLEGEMNAGRIEVMRETQKEKKEYDEKYNKVLYDFIDARSKLNECRTKQKQQ